MAEALSQQVTNLIAEGGTALYQSVCDAMTKMGKLKSADEAAGQNRLYGIVLLSDGKNTGAGKTENQMFETCLPARCRVAGRADQYHRFRRRRRPSYPQADRGGHRR